MKCFASIERLTQKLNNFKPVNEQDLGALKGEVIADVTAKLSYTESKVNDLKAEMPKQSEATKDNFGTLQAFRVSITNLWDNVSKMQQEMTYQRDSEVMEAVEEL